MLERNSRWLLSCSRQRLLSALLAILFLQFLSINNVLAENSLEDCLPDTANSRCLAQQSFNALDQSVDNEPLDTAELNDEDLQQQAAAKARQYELWQADYETAAEPSQSAQPFNKTALDEIVAELEIEQAEAAEKSWLKRLIDWLLDLLKDEEKDDKPPQWLADFFESFDPESLESFSYWMPRIMFALLLLTLAWIVYREIRAAREGGTQGVKGQHRHTEASTYTLQRSKLGLSDALKLPAQQRPSALLRVAIQHLTDAGELPRDSSLTNRELSKSLRQRAPDKTEGFMQLCHAAEETLYGNTEPGNELLEQLANTVETLFQSPKAATS